MADLRNLISAVILYACSIAAGAFAVEATDGLDDALKLAGSNRQQIEEALQKVAGEQADGMRFLVANMPIADLQRLSAEYLLENVEYAYRTRQEATWKDRVTSEQFLNYILPYAVVDERRDNWRKDFYDRFKPLVAEINEPGKAAVTLNQAIFPLLKVRFEANRPKANQGPYETIESGKASCTGLSVLLVDACRAVGVPARLAGTPRWTDNSGNHSWVEIWDGERWRFTGAAEPSGDELDRAWFMGRAVTAQRDDPLHAIYAARFERSPLQFPRAWSRRQGTVYAVNVTDRYTKRVTPRSENEVTARFRVLEGKNGRRIASKLRITDEEGQTIAEGLTRDDRFDPNDHFEAVVPRGNALQVKVRARDRQLQTEITPNHDQELCTFDLSTAEPIDPTYQSFTTTERSFADSPKGKEVAEVLQRYFTATPGQQSENNIGSAYDKLLLENGAALRKLAWAAFQSGYEAQKLRNEFDRKLVQFGDYVSPYVVRTVGSMPADGWPLVIAMHGGGGAPAEVNDSQWRVMQHYYRDQPSVDGYLYLAIRAPNNVWNGFYDRYNLGLTERLIQQFLLFGKVDPNKVYLIGYSHGGYGAFYIGTRMPDRFAAIHASAAAPTGGNGAGKNLRYTQFSFMIGEHDLAHGRLDLCQQFDAYIKELRGDRENIYPVTMEYKEGYRHSGLPDRDKIKELYPAVRDPMPRELSWVAGEKEVDSLNWLRIPDPAAGMEIEATCRDNNVTVTMKNVRVLHVLLDERLVDYGKPLTLKVNGESSSQLVKPSLQTLCETLAERGDPEFMFSTRLVIQAVKEGSLEDSSAK